MEVQLHPTSVPQVVVRIAKPGDDECVARRMREDDRLECFYSGSKSPLDALQYGQNGLTFTVLVDGRPEGMFGVVPAGELGAVWMLGTDDLTKHARVFLLDAPKWIDEIGRDFAVIGGYVWAGNTAHIRWLKRMGFQFFEVKPLGPYKKPFIEFAKCVTPQP